MRRIREFIRRAFNEHDASAIADTFAPGIEWHGGILGTIGGREGMTDLLTKFVEALYVLHCFQKKTQKLPPQDRKIAEMRYRAPSKGGARSVPAAPVLGVIAANDGAIPL